MSGEGLPEKFHLPGIKYLFLIVYLLLNGPAIAQDSSDSLSVVYCQDCIPFEFQNDAGEPAGMIIDHWKLWSDKTGIDVDYQPAPWGETLAMVRDGRVDAHAGLFYSKARDEYLTYGPRLNKSDTHVFYHQALPIAQPQDILSYRVGVIAGDYVEGYLKREFPDLALVGYSDYGELLIDLKSGKLKVFAADTLTGLYHLQQSELATDFQYKANQPLYRSDWFVAVPEGMSDTLTRIQKGMQKISTEDKLEIARRWIVSSGGRDPNTIVVAIDRNYPPFSLLGPDGKPTGMMVEFWRQWSQATDTPINFMPSSWAETIEALKSGVADIHFGLFRNSERETWMDFSKPLHEIETGVYFRANEMVPNPLSKLTGKRVAVMSGSYQESYLKNHHPELQLVSLPDGESLIIALLKGAVDAIVDEIPTVEANLSHLQLKGTLVKSKEALFANTMHAGVRKERKDLVARIDAGFAAIPVMRLSEIESRWITNPDDRYYGVTDDATAQDKVSLTMAEEDWLETHNTLRVGIQPNHPPIEFFDEKGTYSGISSGFLKALCEPLGIKINTAEKYYSSDLIEKMEAGEIDVMPAVTSTKDLGEKMVFTQPYLSFPIVIVMQKNAPIISGLEDVAGLWIGIVKEHVAGSQLMDDHAFLNYVFQNNVKDSLIALSKGDINAFVGDLATVSYNLELLGLSNLKIAAPTPYNIELRIGVKKAWAPLAAMFNKVLDSLSDPEKSAIKKQWIAIKFEHGLEWRTVLKWVLPIAAVLVALLTFTLMWNRRMGREITQRKAAENRFVSLIESAPDAMIIVNEAGQITLVNSQTEILFGYERREMLDQTIELLIPEDKRSRHAELRDAFIKDPAVRSMGIDMNLLGQDKTGRVFPVDISLSPLETDTGLVVVASIRDVTERKKAEEALAAAEEQNRLVLESVGEGILGVDTHGKVTFINPSAEKLLGFNAKEMIGQSIHERTQHTLLDGTPYEKRNSPIYAAYTQGYSNHISNEVLWRKDGTRFFAEYYSTPILKVDAVVGAVITFNDISERIEIEKKLKQNIDGLERFSKLAVGREKSMIELKREINTLMSETGQKPKYKIVTEEAD